VGALTLKRARTARGLSSSDVARVTRLSSRVIAALEEDRFEALPAGIYARTAVQAYARAVGLDPDAILAELEPLLPGAPVDLVVVAELRSPRARQKTCRYGLAGIIDAAVLLTIAGAILVICAEACDVSAFQLVQAAPAPMLLLCSTPVVLYFWLLGATGVRTAGPWLLDLEILPPVRGPLSLNELWHRGAAYVRRELELMFLTPWPQDAPLSRGVSGQTRS
jgi:transcriptional regulator with XRE-family HTH domain